MLTEVPVTRSRQRAAALQCAAVNVIDRLGSAACRILLCSGAGFVNVPYDVRALDDELRLKSEVRRGYRRIEQLLAYPA